MKTIDMTPTWSDILPLLIRLIGNSKTYKDAFVELTRMAQLADSYVESEKIKYNPMSEQQLKLIEFSEQVLSILETQEEWNADTADDIANVSYSMGLGETGEDGMFKKISS
jgi:hypothetical protein